MIFKSHGTLSSSGNEQTTPSEVQVLCCIKNTNTSRRIHMAWFYLFKVRKHAKLNSMLLRDTFRSGKTVEVAREWETEFRTVFEPGGWDEVTRQKEGVDVCAYNPLFINWVRVLRVHFFNTLKKIFFSIMVYHRILNIPLCYTVKVKVAQSCPTLCDPMEFSRQEYWSG